MYIQNKFCKNCGAPYQYQASGEPMFGPFNNHVYCPECQQLIVEVLAKVEKKTEIKWIVSDVTLDKIIEIDNKQGPRIKKVMVTRTKLDGEQERFINVRIPVYQSKPDAPYGEYQCWYYESERDNAKVYVKVRIDLKTKKVIGNVL